MNSKVIKKIIIFLAACICGPVFSATAASQQPSDPFYNINLETRLKREFRLTYKDLSRILPLISRENENVVKTYVHYSDERYRDNFLSLWDGIRSDRWEFETNLPDDLSRQQKGALRAARKEIESRIMDLWLEDYLDFLSGALELDRVQLSYVQPIFEFEIEKRQLLIQKETGKAVRMNSEWQKITDARQRDLKNVLDAEQFRSYLSLGTIVERLIA